MPPTTPAQLQHLWRKLLDAPGGGERRAFADFCFGVLLLADQAEISRGTAVLAIAQVYSIDRFDDSSQMEEIMHLALQLEVPANMNEPQWRKLHGLVSDLARVSGLGHPQLTQNHS